MFALFVVFAFRGSFSSLGLILRHFKSYSAMAHLADALGNVSYIFLNLHSMLWQASYNDKL